MDEDILDDLKQINVQLIKQEQSMKQIMQINHMQNVQYVQQIQNIQHIQQVQSRVREQIAKTGTALKKTSSLFGGIQTAAATVGKAITVAFSALGVGGFLAEAVTGAAALAIRSYPRVLRIPTSLTAFVPRNDIEYKHVIARNTRQRVTWQSAPPRNDSVRPYIPNSEVKH